MRRGAMVVLLAGLALAFLGTNVLAQAVDRVALPISIGTTHGPPSVVVDGSGNVHVIYSRNNSTGTRADLYYRMISFDGNWVATTGAEVCLTEGLGSEGTDSFHMSPRAVIDESGRIHVAFAGYGFDTGNTYFRYNTKLGYLNFPAPTATDYGVGADLGVNSAAVVDNTDDEALDDDIATWNNRLYMRICPNLCVRTNADESTRVDIVFDSEYSGINAGNGKSCPYLCRVEIAVAADGTFDTEENVVKKPIARSGSPSGLLLPSPSGVPFPCGSDGVQIFLATVDVAADENSPGYTYHHIVLDKDGNHLSWPPLGWVEEPYIVVTWLGKHTYSTKTATTKYGVGIDEDGLLHAVGWDDDNGKEIILQTDLVTDSSGVVTAADVTETDGAAAYLVSKGYCRFGARCVGSTLYAPLDGGLLGIPGYAYRFALPSPGREAVDLGVINGTHLVAAYAVGVNCDNDLMNVPGLNVSDNLMLTVFAVPAPSTDLVSWIASPADGATVQLQKRDKGKVTLEAVDGVPGDGEIYTWKEGTTTLGTGRVLTTSFADGKHTVTLEVKRSSSSTEEPRTSTVTFTVKTG